MSKFSLFHGNSKEIKLDVAKVSRHFMNKVTKNYLENMKASDIIEIVEEATYNLDSNEDEGQNLNVTELQLIENSTYSQLSRLEELPIEEEIIKDDPRAYGDTMEFIKNYNESYISEDYIEEDSPELKSNDELITMSTYQYEQMNDITDKADSEPEETPDNVFVEDVEYLLITYPSEDTDDEQLDSELFYEDIPKLQVDNTDLDIDEDNENIYSDVHIKEFPVETNHIPDVSLEQEINLKMEAKTDNILAGKSNNIEVRRSDALFKIPIVTDFDSFESETFSNARLRIPQHFNRIMHRPWRRNFIW